MLKNIVLLTLTLFYSITCLAQDSELNEDFNVKREIKDAKRSLRKGDIYSAADSYIKVIEFAPDRTDIMFDLAEAYRFSRDYSNSAIWYKKTDSIDYETYPLSTYYAGLMLKMNGNCDEAIEYLERFRIKNTGDFPHHYKDWARKEIEGCDFLKKSKNNPLSVKITHLDSLVNSYYTDISPMLWNDSTFLFASLPTDTAIIIDGQTSYKDIYIKFYISKKKDSTYTQAEVFDKFFEEGVHTNNGTFSPDRKRFYFTKCYENFSGVTICSIFESFLFKGQWTTPRALPDVINPGNSNSTQPTIAKHRSGNEVLYFVSDRAEGKGGKDIWYSEIKKNGEYTPPKNAGSKLNTDRDEATPFFDKKTQTLYFSSNGHISCGGYDIFSSKGEMSRWEEPENIGTPINSSADDMYYRMNEFDDSRGYFVSNRPGIISIRGETCCDDIFEFEYYDNKQVFVKGFVFEENSIGKKINYTNVVLLSLDSLNNDGESIKLDIDTTRHNEPYLFKIDFNKNYKIVALKQHYLNGSALFNTMGLDNSDTLEADIYLRNFEKNKAYKLKNVYYDYDKWELRKESERTLDTLYNIMIDNPKIIVEIGSHTDTRGSESYNNSLSQKRAESCVQYLIDKGIGIHRLLARGYGETQLIRADCEKIDECPKEGTGDCPCHQANRRTEFKIVGELDGILEYTDKRYSNE